ncbi:MAG: hypothetical protein ACI83B_002117 [Sediminicola sp.]|jgi:hypothetical protein
MHVFVLFQIYTLVKNHSVFVLTCFKRSDWKNKFYPSLFLLYTTYKDSALIKSCQIIFPAASLLLQTNHWLDRRV